MPTDIERQAERDKYVSVYRADPNYRMGRMRMMDAQSDVSWAADRGCHTYLDIGCGRGEMLEYARQCGFGLCEGTEYVPDLCDSEYVVNRAVHDLHEYADNQFDFVTSFDVIEHLHVGDDELLLVEMSRIAKRCMAITANNRPSIDRLTGNDLHINKREYDEWDEILRGVWEPDWNVDRQTNKQYVSVTWRAFR